MTKKKPPARKAVREEASSPVVHSLRVIAGNPETGEVCEWEMGVVNKLDYRRWEDSRGYRCLNNTESMLENIHRFMEHHSGQFLRLCWSVYDWTIDISSPSIGMRLQTAKGYENE